MSALGTDDPRAGGQTRHVVFASAIDARADQWWPASVGTLHLPNEVPAHLAGAVVVDAAGTALLPTDGALGASVEPTAAPRADAPSPVADADPSSPVADADPSSPAVAGRLGVLVCEPFGIEALAANAALDELARSLVLAGHAVLRFSPPGLGDSDDPTPESSIVGPWLASVDAGIDVLRREAGATRIAVIGLRMGATVAAMATASRGDVEQLVLWAPVSGRHFVRELKMLGASGRSGSVAPEGVAVEAGGFGLNEASAKELGGLDIAAIGGAPAGDVLLIDRDDVPSAARVAARLVELGVHVEAPMVPGYAAMRLDDPEKGELPTVAIGVIARWTGRAHLAIAPQPRRAASAVRVTDVLELAPGGVELTERLVAIDAGDGQQLGAIVTSTSAEASSTGTVIVILTTGANPASGPGRLHTRLARRWAAAGHVVVRVDRRGVGRSAHMTLPASPRTLIPDVENCGLASAYDDVHADDALAIERWLRATWDGASYVLVGTCSGAFTAYHAVLHGAAPAVVVLVNQVIFNDANWTMNAESPAYAIKARYELGQAMRDPKRWAAIVRGEVPVGPALRRLARFVALRARSARDHATARFRAHPVTGVAGDLRRIADAGVRQLYLFDAAETGLGYLRLHAASMIAELSAEKQLRLLTVDDAGHTFAPEVSKRWLETTIDLQLATLLPGWQPTGAPPGTPVGGRPVPAPAATVTTTA